MKFLSGLVVPVLALALLAGCMSGGAGSGRAVVSPDTRAGCEQRGGHWGRGGLQGREMCFMPTSDAGKSCVKSSDCSGFCLAESGSCSAERPLFGCFAYLDDEGREGTLCAD